MGRQAPGFGGVTPPGPGARAGPRERIGLYVCSHHGSLLSRIVAVKPLERTESPSCLSGSAALNAAGTEVDPAGEQGGNVLPVFPVLNDKLRATNIAKAE